ncbi:hypothetical protein C9374_006878 [Naegleria lovaniensis]|uniref:Uncharacterized protein n=1 Tax=Naegleria lovaniensis TaxID=51637 RepID=A0AA88H5V1_NAELO|nr:uncharacterized protein C9374_006878 [Naegleria lovaniensis]KAG2393347.1 hypothetical protein C9374_006878 [Naegleria lovaniensis]
MVVATTTCIYRDGQKQGDCKGLTEESLALRQDLSTLNKNCPMNQVFFYPSTSHSNNNNNNNKTSMEPVCGECIPSSSLFYDYSTNRVLFNYKIVICKMTVFGRQCSEPSASHLPLSDYQCSVGSYCDESGRCRSLNTHPLHGEQCSEVIHPQMASKGVPLSRVCGFDGLECIQGTCQVCKDGVEYTDFSSQDHVYLQQHAIFTRTRDYRRSRRYCVNSQLYPTKFDYTLLSDPSSVLILSFAIMVVLIVMARDFMRFKNTKLAQKIVTSLKLRILYRKNTRKDENKLASHRQDPFNDDDEEDSDLDDHDSDDYSSSNDGSNSDDEEDSSSEDESD